MKVFVATGSGHRQLVSNLDRAVDGEIVWLYCNDEPCAECGGIWSVTGLASGNVAPRFTVSDRPDMTRGEYACLMRDAWLRRGWTLPEDDLMAPWLATQLTLAASIDEGEELSFLDGRLHRTVVSKLR